MAKRLGIYIHIPFCASKCGYCDFYSLAGCEHLMPEYQNALLAHLKESAPSIKAYEVDSLYFGGGTPSFYGADRIADIFNTLKLNGNVRVDSEVTVECNPDSTSVNALKLLREEGVNRLSIGVQATDNNLLKLIGRRHNFQQAEQTVRQARKAGFENINLDLMYALPGQDMARWTDALDAAIVLGVEHLSAYSLIVEPGTPMAARVASGAATVPDDDAVNAMQRQAIARLEAAGYRRYEISNYARPGRECRHNLVYWNRGDYLGLGCAAHSLLGGRRFHNPEALDAYLAGVRRQDEVRLILQDEMEETLMLSTRTVRGLDLAAWESAFGAPFERGREAAIGRLEKGGLVELAGGRLRLTTRGMEVQDAVVLELLGENE